MAIPFILTWDLS